MQIEHRFLFANKSVVIKQRIDDKNAENHVSHIWPSALVLSLYMQQINVGTILELGCGLGLPSISYAVTRNCHIILTDRPVPDQNTWQMNMQEQCSLNGLDRVSIVPIRWGYFDFDLDVESIDMIIASDCFYDPRDFDDVLATVRYLFDCYKCDSFVTTYHERSEDRNLQFLLSKWGFTATEVQLESFFTSEVFEKTLQGQPSDTVTEQFTSIVGAVKLYQIKSCNSYSTLQFDFNTNKACSTSLDSV
jgi:hypothetical protein